MERGRFSRCFRLGVAIVALTGLDGAAHTAPRGALETVQHSPVAGSDSGRLRDRAEAAWRRLPPTGTSTAGAITGTVWKPIGPSPISEQGCCGSTITFLANGRVNSIAVDPSDPNRIYVGSAGGGVWRSVDGGTTWTPLTDPQPSLGIGSSHAIAIDPSDSNIVYAGTTNFALLAQSQQRPIDLSQSKGILKSTDGGESWIVLGSGVPSGNNGNALAVFSNTDINTMIVDPAVSNTLYVAAGRSVPGGLFLSTDGGSIWTPGASGVGLAESLVLDTSSPLASRVLYAGLNGAGVLRSADGGQSWSSVLSPTTPVVAAAAPNGFSKVIVALAPTAASPNPSGQVVYVTLLDQLTGNGLIFENTNGGAPGSWTQKNATVVSSSNGFSTLGMSPFSDMVVDPASPGDGANDLIYWGAFTQFLSTDSGNTFNEIGQIRGTHGDHQTFFLAPRPGDTSVIYAGDDGGIWKSVDQGASWSGTSLPGSPPTVNAGGLQIGTFYALAVKQDATASVTLGGMQDSGRGRTTGSLLWSGTSIDGIDVAFDKVATGTAYSIENGCGGDCLLKSTDSGASFVDITPPTLPVQERGTFRNRLAVDPNNAGVLYFGGSAGSVFQSTDAGATFRSLGTPTPGKYIASLDVAPASSSSLVIAANDLPLSPSAVASRVFVTTDAFAPSPTLQDITRDLPTRFVTRVAFDPADPTLIYATLAGFGATTPLRPGHVYRTTLGATTWTDISPQVDVPANAIILDGTSSPAVLYVGTDLGVMRTVDGGSSWAVVDDPHLPNAAVSDLELNPQAGVLRAATWGRGVFELAAPTGPAISLAQSELAFGVTCAGGVDLAIDVSNVGTQSLVIASVARLAGSTDFTVLANPATPLAIGPGGQVSFTVHFAPSSPGAAESAVIRVSSNDPLAPFVDLSATGVLDAQPPAIACPPGQTIFGGPGGDGPRFHCRLRLTTVRAQSWHAPRRQDPSSRSERP